MSATEKEAKFLFCPLLTGPDGKLRFCQAAQCMMWRWRGDESGEQARGFCGLAGAPLALAKGKAPGFLSAGDKKSTQSPFD
jgi:hypothetical protein